MPGGQTAKALQAGEPSQAESSAQSTNVYYCILKLNDSTGHCEETGRSHTNTASPGLSDINSSNFKKHFVGIIIRSKTSTDSAS